MLGALKTVEMRSIENFETIGHLHALRARYPNESLDVLIPHTASYRYA